jgi:hypothetical protein
MTEDQKSKNTGSSEEKDKLSDDNVSSPKTDKKGVEPHRWSQEEMRKSKPYPMPGSSTESASEEKK